MAHSATEPMIFGSPETNSQKLSKASTFHQSRSLYAAEDTELKGLSGPNR